MTQGVSGGTSNGPATMQKESTIDQQIKEDASDKSQWFTPLAARSEQPELSFAWLPDRVVTGQIKGAESAPFIVKAANVLSALAF